MGARRGGRLRCRCGCSVLLLHLLGGRRRVACPNRAWLVLSLVIILQPCALLLAGWCQRVIDTKGVQPRMQYARSRLDRVLPVCLASIRNSQQHCLENQSLCLSVDVWAAPHAQCFTSTPFRLLQFLLPLPRLLLSCLLLLRLLLAVRRVFQRSAVSLGVLLAHCVCFPLPPHPASLSPRATHHAANHAVFFASPSHSPREIGVSLPSGRSTVVFTFYAGVARSRPGSSSFTALALNKPSSSPPSPPPLLPLSP